MADDDNFDIDIYGDDPNPDMTQEQSNDGGAKQEGLKESSEGGTITNPKQDNVIVAADSQNDTTSSGQAGQDVIVDSSDGPQAVENQQISSTGGPPSDQVQPPKQAPVQQGNKPKDGNDDRPVDPGATSAVVIADLHWWTTEDDIRGWSNQAGVEDELQEVSFNEHKVNGKSKGQAYVVLASPQAATALKHKIESFGHGQQYAKKHAITYHAAHINPYKTLPKDVPGRKEGRQDNRGSSVSYSQGNTQSYNRGGYNGGRGGSYNNRNNMNMGYNANRNFSSPVGGMQNGGFGGPMSNFAGNPMGAMQQFSNFNRGGIMGAGMRGGMLPARGGRGGMNPGMMGAMSLGGMNMGAMGMGAMGNMGGMGAMGAMGMGGMQGPVGLGNVSHMNPTFFGQSQASGGDNWNPHGAKRPRPE